MVRIGFVGSRQFHDAALVERVMMRLSELYPGFTFVSGECPQGGADIVARDVYKKLFPNGQLILHPPNSDKAYKAFGARFRDRAFGRNKWIVDDSDIIVAFYVTPEPKGGTLNTHNHARRKGIPIYYTLVNPTPAKEGVVWYAENVPHPAKEGESSKQKWDCARCKKSTRIWDSRRGEPRCIDCLQVGP